MKGLANRSGGPEARVDCERFLPHTVGDGHTGWVSQQFASDLKIQHVASLRACDNRLGELWTSSRDLFAQKWVGISNL
jgi:hypothetical protein